MFRHFIILLFPMISFGQIVENDHELLWEISRKDMPYKCYLFGSFHSNDKRLFRLSDSTYLALNNSKIIALETDVFSMFESLDTRNSSISMKYDNQGNPYVSSADPTATFYGDEDGMPQFLDAYFQQYCYKTNKQFEPLEDVDFQLDVLSDIQEPELSSFRFQSLFSSREDFIELYLKGDIYRLDEMLKSSLAIYPEGYNKLIVQRNFTMVEKLDSLIQLAPVFCAVGAGHLASGTGIINLLRSKGYSLRKVTASFNELISEEKKQFYTYNTKESVLEEYSLHMLFPGKPLVLDQNEDMIGKYIYKEFGQGNGYEVEVYPRMGDIGLKELADIYIASPLQSPSKKIYLDNGGEAYQGIADTYTEGLYWVRIIMNEDIFVIIKAYGGNKFMNSKRPFRFFDNIWFE